MPRGGARAGAGRKASGVETKVVRMPTKMMGEIMYFMESEGCKLPLYAHHVPAGAAVSADDSVDRRLSPNDLVRNPGSTFWFKVSGRSMEPLIFDGDLLLCDRSIDPVVSGDIVLASVHGAQTVKRYQRIKGRFWLVAENPAFDPLLITEEMEFSIQGVVLHIIRPTHQRFRPDR